MRPLLAAISAKRFQQQTFVMTESSYLDSPPLTQSECAHRDHTHTCEPRKNESAIECVEYVFWLLLSRLALARLPPDISNTIFN